MNHSPNVKKLKKRVISTILKNEMMLRRKLCSCDLFKSCFKSLRRLWATKLSIWMLDQLFGKWMPLQASRFPSNNSIWLRKLWIFRYASDFWSAKRPDLYFQGACLLCCTIDLVFQLYQVRKRLLEHIRIYVAAHAFRVVFLCTLILKRYHMDCGVEV